MSGNRLTALDFFASELRHARAAAGLSQDQLGHAIAYSASLVAMVETAKRTPSVDFARRCDSALGTDGLLGRILTDLVGRELAPEWFRPWISLEREATALRSYQPLLVQGLLQTPAYMRAVLRSGAALTEDELDQQLTARIKRQEILTRANPPMVIAILDEGVLRRPVGGPKVIREQLLHLVDLAAGTTVLLQVVPAGTGMHPGLNGPFVIASFDGAGEIAYLDNQLRGQVVDNPDDVSAVKRSWESLRGEALTRRQSTDLILEVAQTWT